MVRHLQVSNVSTVYLETAKTNGYTKFKKLEKRLEQGLTFTTYTVYPSALIFGLAVAFLQPTPFLHFASDALLVTAALLTAYFGIIYYQLKVNKERFITNNQLADFVRENGTTGAAVFKTPISSRTAKKVMVGSEEYFLATNVEVEFMGEIEEVDVYFKEDSLNNYNMYRGTSVYIYGNTTLFVDGKVRS